MTNPAEQDPQLQHMRQATEIGWSPHDVEVEKVIECFGTEFGLAKGEGPVDEETTLRILSTMPDALHPDSGLVDAVKTRAAYLGGALGVGRALLQPHVDAKGSKISMLGDDPEAYPAQHPMTFYVDGNLMPRENTDYIADMTEPRYLAMIKELGARSSVKEAVRHAIELQKQGISVMAITPHAGDVIDTAYGMKIGLDLFDDQGFKPDMTMFNLSKALAWGEYDVPEVGPVVMMDVVKMLAQRIYLPWPKTKSSEAALSNIPSSEVNRYNGQISQDTIRLLTEGVYGAMSPSGSTRNTADAPNVHSMGRVNKGTMNLMMHPNVYVMPMPMWRLGEEYVADCLMPVKIENEAQGHAVMGLMADSLTAMLKKKTGKSFHYAAA